MQLADKTTLVGKRTFLDVTDGLDQVEILIARGMFDAAFESIKDLVQLCKLNTNISVHRCQILISHLHDHVSSENNAHALLLLCQYISRSGQKFSLLESINLVAAIEKSLLFPAHTVTALEVFISLMDVLNFNLYHIMARIRSTLLPLFRSPNYTIQRLSIECIDRIFCLFLTKDSLKISAEEEFTMLMSVIPGLLKQEAFRNLLVALQCFFDCIPFAKSMIQSSSTSVLLILRRSLALSQSRTLSTPNDMQTTHENGSLFGIRYTVISCIKKIAYFMPSLLKGCWSTFLPLSSTSTQCPSAFGSSTIVSLMINDPSPKIRHASSEALVAMIEGAPSASLPYDNLSGSITNVKSYLNPWVQNTIDALHFECLHGISGSTPDFSALKVISCLAARVSYASLPHSKEHLTQIFLKLLSLLEDCKSSSMKHDLFICLSHVASASLDHKNEVIEFALQTLLKEYRLEADRSPPNALTVIARISSRHSSLLSSYWSQIQCEISGALQHRNEHVRISALALIEAWLRTTENVINTFLTIEGGEDLLHAVAGMALSGSLNLRCKCLITLSRISHHSWNNEITDSTRRRLRNLLQDMCCIYNVLASPIRFQNASLRFIGTLAAYCIDDPIIEKVLLHLLKFSSPRITSSVRTRVAQALSDILDSLCSPSKCVDVLAVLLDKVFFFVDQLLCSGNYPIIINGIRSCASLFKIGCFRDRGQTIIPKLLGLLKDNPSNVKIQWNVCRAFGPLLASDHNIDILEAVLLCCKSSNHKVATSAFNALCHPQFFIYDPTLIQRFVDVIEISSAVSNDCEFLQALLNVSAELTDVLSSAALPLRNALLLKGYM